MSKTPDNKQGLPNTIWLYILGLLSIIVIRILLETFSDRETSEVTFAVPANIFLHYIPWFLVIFAGLTLTISSITKLKLKKVFEFIVRFSPIILIPPVIDLIVSSGRGLNMMYVIPQSWKDFFYSLITLGGENWTEGATIGIRIEVVIVVIGIFIFAMVFSRNWWRSLLSALASYFVIMIAGMAPFLFNQLAKLFDLQQQNTLSSIWGNMDETTFAIEIGSAFFLILFLLVFLIAIKQHRGKIALLLKNIRPERAMIYVIFAFLGLAISYSQFGSEKFSIFDVFFLACLAISIFFAWSQAALANDIVDIKIDQISNPERGLITEDFTKRQYILLTVIFTFISLIAAAYVNFSVFILVLAYMTLTFLYSLKPFHWRNRAPLSNFIIGCATLLCVLSGYSFFSPEQNFNQFPIGIVIVMLLLVTVISVMKDLKDTKADLANKIHTIPNFVEKKLGFVNAQRVTGLIVAVSFCLTPIILKNHLQSPTLTITVAFIFAITLYVLITSKKIPDKYYFITANGFMLFLIISIIVGNIHF